MLAVIGSVALNQSLGRDIRRPRDWDLVGTIEEATAFVKQRHAIKASYPINEGKTWVFKCAGGMIFELEIAWPGSLSEELLDMCKLGLTNCSMGGVTIPHLDILYMLKMSHRYRKNSPHFTKTMNDILLMRQYGAFIRREHQDFYERRMKATYNYGFPKLNVSKDEFFKGDGVEYVYDHDSIHEAMKTSREPAYKAFKKGEVACDKGMFYSCVNESGRLCAVLEEAYVLALERSIIPHPGGMTDKQAFDYALMKVCTSITSGWFREYAWEHYHEVQGLYDPAYTGRFWNAVKNGAVKKL